MMCNYIRTYMHLYVYVCVYVYMYSCVNMQVATGDPFILGANSVDDAVDWITKVYICVCICIHICIYTHMHILTYVP